MIFSSSVSEQTSILNIDSEKLKYNKIIFECKNITRIRVYK